MNTVVVSNQENTVTNIQSSKGNIATDVQSNQGNVVTDIQVEFNRSQVVYKDGDYNRLTNKPSINGHELIGDKNSSQLNLLGEFHSYVTYLEFPVVPNSGWENDIFLDTTNNKIYRWDTTDMKYFCIGSNYDDIEIINGGSAI
nr:MAG TPA: hypothetical protein [Caudoviricetes sp.]